MPQLTFVVPSDSWDRLADVVRALERQEPPIALEVVVVTPDPAHVSAPPEWEDRVTVAVGPDDDVSAAHAAGVAAASAPVVFLGETHAFPSPATLPALLAAFDDPSVGCAVPRLANANPATSRSWVALHVAYGRWLAFDGDEVSTPPAFNAAWRREALVSLRDRLPEALGAGGGVDVMLGSSGLRFVAVPDAVVEHLNVVRPWAWLTTRVDSSRVFAGSRSRAWSRGRRALYTLGAPVLAPLITWRVLRSPAWGATAAQRGHASVPLLAVSSVAAALGEALGYVSGAGGARRRVAHAEIRRSSYV